MIFNIIRLIKGAVSNPFDLIQPPEFIVELLAYAHPEVHGSGVATSLVSLEVSSGCFWELYIS